MSITVVTNAIAPLKLSANFTGHEYRCRGFEQEEPCACHGAVLAHPDLVAVDQAWRDILGEPITLTSAFRCETWNKHVGGDKNSAHKLGCASDKTSPKIREYVKRFTGTVTNGDIVDTIAEIIEATCGPKRGNIIIYPQNGFIHSDVWDRMSPTGHMIRVKQGRGATPYDPVEWFTSVI